MSQDPQLPRRWLRAFERAVPAEDREWLRDELAVLYRHRLERDGRRAADRWIRRELMGYVTHVPLERLRNRGRGLARSMVEDGMGGLMRDVRRGVRSLLKNPGFALVAIATLTLGIGANTVMYSVVDHVALRPLPFPESDRLVAVWPRSSFMRGELEVVEAEAESFAQLTAYTAEGLNLASEAGVRRVEGWAVLPNFLETLGVTPVLGRDLPDDSRQPGRDAYVLVSHDLWRSELGGDPSIVGRTLVLDGRAREVVGVLPADFAFPDADGDVLVPLEIDPSQAGRYWGSGGVRGVARLADGATPESARAELDALADLLRSSNTIWTPGERFYSGRRVVPLRDQMVSGVRSGLLVLLGSVGLVLLVACANVANLLLVRSLQQSREIAVRISLGAGRGQVVRERVVEGVLLALAGCAVALFVAALGLELIVSAIPADIPRAETIRLDGRVTAVAIVLSLLAGALASGLPAVFASKVPPSGVLRSSGRSGGSAPAARRLASGLVVSQLALAVVLISVAGLLVRSLTGLTSVDPGFDPDGVTVLWTNLDGTPYEAADARPGFYEAVLAAMEAIPGVRSAAMATRVPFGPGRASVATAIAGVTDDTPNELPVFERLAVTADYFRTLGVPLLEGRTFGEQDRAGAPQVVIVDRTAAERFWPGESPLGKVIRYPWQGAPDLTVVGVVENVADGSLTSEPRPTYYEPLMQARANAAVVVRGGDEALGSAMRAALAGVDDRVPVSRVATATALVGDSLARTRWTATLLGVFALLTLVLACVGVYGVTAYAVRERTRDIGVRMALGAGTDRIRRGVAAGAFRMAAIGAVVGLLGALGASRLVREMLFGVEPYDPLTLLAVVGTLAGAAAVAAYLPARRATRVDPMEALRADG